MLNRLVLVLNASYEPLLQITAKRALTLVCKGAAVVQEVSPYVVHTSKIDFPVPSVIRLVRYRRVPRMNRSMSRKGVLLRDSYTCQYCGERKQAGELTLDHVIPKSRGGPNTWENMVSSCFPCNNRKGNRTPEEAGMPLSRRPIQLNVHSKHRLMAGVDQKVWDKYMFV